MLNINNQATVSSIHSRKIMKDYYKTRECRTAAKQQNVGLLQNKIMKNCYKTVQET